MTETQITQLLQYLGDMVASGALVSYGLEYLKKTPYFPLINKHTKRVNFAISGMLAFFTSLGISAAWTPNGDLLISGLSFALIWEHGSKFVSQWLLQQGVYTGLIAKQQAPAVTLVQGSDPRAVLRTAHAVVEAAFARMAEDMARAHQEAKSSTSGPVVSVSGIGESLEGWPPPPSSKA